MGPRYAIYYAPKPGSKLARFGAEWLGYDITTGATLPQPVLCKISSERLCEITAEPRRYGFHATLKPPFSLAEGCDAAALDAAVAALAADAEAFEAPRLQLTCLTGFWALTFSEPCPEMDRLAERCVAEFDRFRAPPSPTEFARRREAGLSLAQEALLRRWGYPYVMTEFRFHMTLTGRLDPVEGAQVAAELAPLCAPFCESGLLIDAIGLFRQTPDHPFRLLRHYKLTG